MSHIAASVQNKGSNIAALAGGAARRWDQRRLHPLQEAVAGGVVHGCRASHGALAGVATISGAPGLRGHQNRMALDGMQHGPHCPGESAGANGEKQQPGGGLFRCMFHDMTE